MSSFVPTDVDNQIRFKLWHPELPLDTTQSMAELVLEAQTWELRAISERYVLGPKSGKILSGMQGEWLSIASAAYCATRKKEPQLAEKVAVAIEREITLQAQVFSEFIQTKDGIGALKAATTIAHNLGDLDRVFDQWNLEEDDPLRRRFYKLGHEAQAHSEDLHTRKLLVAAGALNKTQLGATSMADENHRHFALRAAKCLRKTRDLLLPIAPFFDDWGARVGKHPALRPEEVGEIVECLMTGWEKLKPQGRTLTYPRALAGIESTFPGGLQRLCQYLPAKAAKTLRAGALRTLCSTRQSRFEEQLASQALAQLKLLLK